MGDRPLYLANAALALALGRFIYVMLPFAEGVACDGGRAVGRACSAQISPTMLLLYSMAPAAIIAGLVLLSFRFSNRPKARLFLWFAPTAAAILLLCVVAPRAWQA